MEIKKKKNRWIMLFCICCNTFCFGGVYAWSAFSGELANYMGWDYSKVTVAYSIMLMCVAFMGLVGGMFLVVSLATSWYIDGPPAGWKPEGYTPAAAQTASEGKTWREMLKDPRCYLLWATLLCALDMVFLSSVSTFPAFVAAIVITGVCFGGTLATFSALSSDTFGAKYNGINYSIIFTGYGIASIVGPNVATAIKSSSGSYSGAFIFAAVCSILAAALCFAAKQMNRKMG